MMVNLFHSDLLVVEMERLEGKIVLLEMKEQDLHQK